MARPRAVFRCDGGVKLGAGHLARCLTLAEGLAAAGWDCAFFVNSEAKLVLPRLFSSQHEIQVLAEDARFAPDNIRVRGGELLIVDHYQLGREFELAVRASFKLVMAIDDLEGRSHSCDILLNQNLEPEQASASGSVKHLLYGRQFALLAPKFAALRDDAMRRRRSSKSVRRLLICFGASDPNDFCSRAAKAVLRSQLECDIDVAVSGASPNAEHLRGLREEVGNKINLHFDAVTMPELMAEADLSIGAAGAATWERCCLGLPTIVYQIVENQAQIAQAISKTGAALVMKSNLGNGSADLSQAVRDLSYDVDRRYEMSKRAANMVDGRGVERLVESVATLMGSAAVVSGPS